MQNQPRKSDEPIYWLLFGAGGMAAGIVLPSIILLLIFAGLGSPSIDAGLLSFAHVKGMLGNWFISLCLFATVALTFWHCLHRIYHGAHDLSLPSCKAQHYIIYGLAMALTSMLFAFHLLAYVQLF